MENELKLFNNEEFGNVRVVEIDGREYFVANDVAKALGYSNPQKAIRDHCKGVNETFIPTNGGEQQIKIIPEGDIYRLIVRSKLPTADKFEKWIMEDVVPSIRKHGTYMTPETIEKVLLNPDMIIQLATQLKEEQQARKVAEQIIEEQKSLVVFAETCIKSKDNILVRQVSKIAQDEGINIGEKKLYNKLREWGLILKFNTEPSQIAMNKNLFLVEEKPFDTPYGTRLSRTTKVTPKGQVYIIEKLKRELEELNK